MSQTLIYIAILAAVLAIIVIVAFSIRKSHQYTPMVVDGEILTNYMWKGKDGTLYPVWFKLVKSNGAIKYSAFTHRFKDGETAYKSYLHKEDILKVWSWLKEFDGATYNYLVKCFEQASK